MDSLFNRRFYVFFIIRLATRRIEHCSVTLHPSYQFVRQRIINFSEGRYGKKTFLIHDRSPELNQKYAAFNITGVKTSVESPNMNAYAERFVRSIRRDALDRFIILHESQLRNIILQYVDYYNSLRPHQGIDQSVPDGYQPQPAGTIVSKPILSGLHHHYHRIPA